MSSCGFYKQHRQQRENAEVKSHQQAEYTYSSVAWCSHKHSPAPFAMIDTIGSGSRLQCGGLFEKCPIPKNLFPDVG